MAVTASPNRRLSVAIVVSEMNIRGGTHKQVHRLGKYLQRGGHSVAIYTHVFDPSRCYPGIETLRVIAANKKLARIEQFGPLGFIKYRWQWIVDSWRLFVSIPRSIDVVNVHGLGCEPVIVFTMLFRNSARLIWQINDLPYSFHVGHFAGTPDRFRNRLVRSFYRYIAQRCHRITVNVSKNKELVRDCLRVNAELAYPGVDICNVGVPERSHPMQPVELVSTGVLFPYRNYETVIEVQKLLIRKHAISSRLRIVGSTALSPTYVETISALIREAGVDATILGEVAEADLDRIYREADYFLFLNIDQSWGLSVLEAMNYRLPVIVSKSVGATEILHDQVDAIIVDPKNAETVADQIAALQAEPLAYMAVANQAFEATTEMSWDRMYCPQIETLMQQLVAQYNSTRKRLHVGTSVSG